LVTYGVFLAVLIAPVDEIASIGPQVSEALVALERHRFSENERTRADSTVL
jgi:hypothetical protein